MIHCTYIRSYTYAGAVLKVKMDSANLYTAHQEDCAFQSWPSLSLSLCDYTDYTNYTDDDAHGGTNDYDNDDCNDGGDNDMTTKCQRASDVALR